MSLSAGQQAILRALGEGREIRGGLGVLSNRQMYWYVDNLSSINVNTVESLKKRGYVLYATGFGRVHTPVTLTPAGHAALRALEQEAG